MEERIGYVGVDAGLMWVGDPCYCVTPDATNHPAKTWDEFCEKLEDSKFDENGHCSFGNTGMAVSSGYGDGTYPVYVTKNKDGRVMSVTVRFDEQEDCNDCDDEMDYDEQIEYETEGGDKTDAFG